MLATIMIILKNHLLRCWGFSGVQTKTTLKEVTIDWEMELRCINKDWEL